jgi:ABC-2 type transport system permease protein
MKIIYKIAKNELSILFYSPIAWLLACVFLLQGAMMYIPKIDGLVIQQNMGEGYSQGLSQLTDRIFSGDSGLYSNIISKIYLFMPLLTMGLISREVSSGTIKLLYSSPVTSGQIILGKFLSMMMYSLLMVLILALFGILGIIEIQQADLGLICSALFGIYLLICTYAAIGLFMSCLSSYQVVAAIGTFVVFAVLEYLKNLWQGVSFVRDFTYFLSISGRAQGMVEGLISSKDVIYFLLIISMFLLFSMIRLNTGRRSTRTGVIAAQYGVVIMTVLAIGYITSLPSLVGYIDMTTGKTLTLTPTSQQIIKEMRGKPLEITSYINLFESNFWRGTPEQRNAELKRWEPYSRFKPDIKLNYVYFYGISPENELLLKYNPGKTLKQIAKQATDVQGYDFNMFRSPEEIARLVPATAEENRYFIQMKYNGRSTIVHMFGDMLAFPSETETDAGLKRLLITRAPKIAFVTGEGERSAFKSSDKDYKLMITDKPVRQSIINQGFDVVDIWLQKQNIPAGITALVIADPQTAFAPQTIEKIINYINAGGNLLIAGELSHKKYLEPVLRRLGVDMAGSISQNKSESPDLIMSFITPQTAGFSKSLLPVLKSKNPIGVSMPGVAALTYKDTAGFKPEPLLITDNKAGVTIKGKVITGAYPTTIGLSRYVNNKIQKIIVSGDADFLSNSEMRRGSNLNQYVVSPIFGWFTGGVFPIDTSHPDPKDNRLKTDLEGVRNLKIIFYGMIPAALLISMSFFLIKRKRQ